MNLKFYTNHGKRSKTYNFLIARICEMHSNVRIDDETRLVFATFVNFNQKLRLLRQDLDHVARTQSPITSSLFPRVVASIEQDEAFSDRRRCLSCCWNAREVSKHTYGSGPTRCCEFVHLKKHKNSQSELSFLLGFHQSA